MINKNLLSSIDHEAVLKKALARGGDFADIFAEEKSTTLIEVEAERVERLVQGSRSGAGVRVLHSHRTSYSYTDFIADSPLLECASLASMAVNGRGAESKYIKASGEPRSLAMRVSKPADQASIEDKLDIIWRAEKAARTADKRIRQVKVILADQYRSIAVANSEGLLVADRVPYLVFYVVAVAADDVGIQIAHESMGGAIGIEAFDDNSPEELARTASARAVRNLLARPAPAGAMPVVLAAEAGGTMIHEAVGHGLEADLAEQGLSVYEGHVGDKIASPLITVLDDATIPAKRGSFNFDDEGEPAQKTVLVEKGVLKSYMYDRRLAMKTGGRSTGNGRRESYAFPPVVRMTNTLIAPGESDPRSILKSIDRGLLVRRMGGGEVNTVNGDFVFDVEEGWLVEKGAAVEPVRGATLTGNGPRVLREIDMVGSDLGYGIGTCGKDGQGVPVADAQPTLRIPEIVVGGRVEA